MAAVEVCNVSHRYGARQALEDVTFDVGPGEIHGLLGPNGGGKTTLFRLLAGALGLQSGVLRVMGYDAATQPNHVRRQLGVVFQRPSLDKKLTVAENFKYHAWLYGMAGKGSQLAARIDELANRFGIGNRLRDRVDTLSGGLARRAELVKALLHRPPVLILDEPSSGLDPAARLELAKALQSLKQQGVTVLLTTHFIEEAERCDRLGILAAGRLVANEAPAVLRAQVGGEVVTVTTAQPDQFAAQSLSIVGCSPQVSAGQVRFAVADGFALARQLHDRFGALLLGISVARPTLEDVFLQRTGRSLWSDDDAF